MLASDLRFALDPVCFAEEALHFVPDEWQKRVLRWSGKRLLLNCCRQAGKSTTAAIVALHRALFYPGSLVLLVSPSLRQSGELFRKVSEHLDKLHTAPRKLEDNRLSVMFGNESRIVSLPSTEDTIRGFSRASLIIEDEAARVSDELYVAIRPMLAVSGGRLILLATPFGKRGHFFKEYAEGGPEWERIKITATEYPRITAEFLQQERASLGDWWFRQEYMCEFVETVDQVFTYDMVQETLTSDITPLFKGGAS
jgi:hypothetical protein